MIGPGDSTMEPFAGRRDRLRVSFRDEGLDALLITNPLNVCYLTNFSGDSSYLLLTASRALLISDGRFPVHLAEECPALPAHIRPPAKTVQQAAGEVLVQHGVHAVGFESGHLTVAEIDRLRELTPGLDWKGGG